jgi:pimeloyl-ACP methyl ester carboxylesterase
MNSTVVLVHGAWADGSCWRDVVIPLERQGLKVVCAPIPLTSLSNDIAALNRALERTTGPVVAVGHAYGGAVIAGAREERVKSLRKTNRLTSIQLLEHFLSFVRILREEHT